MSRREKLKEIQQRLADFTPETTYRQGDLLILTRILMDLTYEVQRMNGAVATANDAVCALANGIQPD